MPVTLATFYQECIMNSCFYHIDVPGIINLCLYRIVGMYVYNRIANIRYSST